MSAAAAIAGAVAFGCVPLIGWPSAWAQTGALPGTVHPAPEHPSRSASRQPGHHEEHAGRATPVVSAHGSSHPHKPHTAVAPPAPARPAPVEAPPAASPSAPSPEAEKPQDVEKPDGSEAKKLPRFASLRADEVNMRAGPGRRYRINWVYKRRDLPVEIMREYDVWRWVRDPDGIEGWMQQATLMGRRTFIVQKADATLRAEASDAAAAVAILKPGVIGRIRSCEAASDWCNVQAGSYRGYLRREQFWGVFPGEAINP
ncbi:hypothetical protein CCS01_20685 [Rhodopila globiformis]|uniref:SH3b domain-containing protein n=1 Tax=Rhodopila globiformis TaxID=1071 RepID=A0A2S6N511_RHOGL|nr:hypothetical protein CCS01_20685 [Rhodopila globiformis]